MAYVPMDLAAAGSELTIDVRGRAFFADLQEALQAHGLALPVYTLTAVTGDAHAQSFTVMCEVPIFELAAVGEGGSRRRAEQLAAAKLLEHLPAETLSPDGRPPDVRKSS